MNRILGFVGSVLACLGCSSPSPDGKQIEDSIRGLTDAESDTLDVQRNKLIRLLNDRYGDVDARGPDDRLQLLQRLHDDGGMSKLADVHSVGTIFGDAIADQSQLKWVTVDWEGTRIFALNFPKSTILIFPESMIEKRLARNEKIHFANLVRDTVQQVEELKRAPEYQR